MAHWVPDAPTRLASHLTYRTPIVLHQSCILVAEPRGDQAHPLLLKHSRKHGQERGWGQNRWQGQSVLAKSSVHCKQ